MKTVDYFAGVSSEDIYSENIVIEEKIHDELPKYYTGNFMDFDPGSVMKEAVLKSKFNEIGMFCFVAWNWVEPLSKWLGERKCLEVMAGRGWLSKGLREKGVDVIATDNFSWHKMPNYNKWNNLVTEVENLDAIESVKKYGKDIDILIMTWAYMDDVAYQVIKELHKVNPKALVIFCGEGKGGCTANNSFYDHFKDVVDTDFENKVASQYKTWYGLHDRLTLGKYTSHDNQ